jgi:hypothetical protein
MDGLSFDRNFVALSEVTVNNNRLAVTYPVNWFVNEGRSHALGPNYSDLYLADAANVSNSRVLWLAVCECFPAQSPYSLEMDVR